MSLFGNFPVCPGELLTYSPDAILCHFISAVLDVVTFNRTKGVFTSPNFPRHYDNDIHKLWRLQVNSGSCIKLSFEHFNLRQCRHSANCECDYIRIGEGKNHSVASHGQFCGRSVLSEFTSQGPLMWLEFMSDSNSTSTGFQAIYEETTCVGPSEAPESTGMSGFDTIDGFSLLSCFSNLFEPLLQAQN